MKKLKERSYIDLVRWKKFGASYADKRDAVKGMPLHLIGKGLKLVDEMVKSLLLEHKGGKCVSINLAMKDEVDKLVSLWLS